MNNKNNDSNDNDLDVLYPNRTIELAGESVTFNEISFVVGLKLTPVINPLINDIARLFGDSTDPGFNDIAEVFATHVDAMLTMLATVTDKDRAWFESLDDSDGQMALMTLWGVNRDFFTRRVVTASIEQMQAGRRQQDTQQSPSGSPGSTAH